MRLSDRLGNLKEISLGQTEATMAQLKAVEAAFPNAELNWKVTILGEETDCRTTTLDLTAARDEDVEALAAALTRLPELWSVKLASDDGTTSLSFESLAALAAAAPEANLNCRFELFGQTADWTTEELRYENQNIGNEAVSVFGEALPYLRSLKLLRLEQCGIDDHEGMDALRDAFPEVNVVWTVYLAGYPFMTDTTMIHFQNLRDSDAPYMKYFRDVVGLDIGHDLAITNLEFVRDLPKLTTVIISLTNLSDISPFEACPDITFFECFTTKVADISVLAKLEKLEYLNLGNDPNITDITALYGLKNLKLVRFVDNPRLPKEQIDKLRELMPDTVVSTVGGHPAFSGGWRYDANGQETEEYKRVSELFLYYVNRTQGWDKSLSNSPSREG